MNSRPKSLPGVNIQWPWSEWIASGKKTVETRGYAIPPHYLNQPLALIETPGPRGKAHVPKARITAIVRFGDCFIYQDQEHWAEDFPRHWVKDDDPQFGFRPGKEKWGWVVAAVQRLPVAVPAPQKKGIVFTTSCDMGQYLI